MSTVFTDIVGMTGTFLVVLAYYLLQLERLDAKGMGYNLLSFDQKYFWLII